MSERIFDLEVRLAPTDSDAGTFTGYASVWGVKDSYGDVIARGAFAASLAAHKAAGTRPLLLWQHYTDEPIGVWAEIKEDANGLLVSGRLVLETTRGREAHALLKAGALNGLSIGFKTVRAASQAGGGRLLQEIDLIEISLVSRPALGVARVTAVKSENAAGAAPHKENTRMSVETKEAAPGAESGDVGARVGALEESVAGIDTRLKSMEEAVGNVAKSAERIETVLRRPGATVETRQHQPGDIEARSFSTFIRRGREAMGADEIRSLRVSDDTAGGYLAPDQFVAELLRNIVAFSPVRQVARVANITAGAALLPRRTGGMTAQWVGETSARPETTVTFGQARFPVCELAAYVDVSNAMLEDSAFNIASELAFEFAEEFGRAEGAAFVDGASTLQPAGFMQNADLAYTASGSGSAILADGLIQLFHDLPAVYRANAVWGMNSDTLATVRKLKDGTSGQYLLMTEGIGNAPTTTLLGRPVIELPDMPDIAGNAFPVIFGDFKMGYRIFDRIALSVLRDPYSQATNGMTRFHGRRRVAAGVAKAEALRKLKIAAS